MSADQIRAADPSTSVFVLANAGSGKTSTLVRRVARLLLRGAKPEAILCVTYTKAAAAEMQRRLFELLGDWAVMEDGPLAEKLADLEEAGADLSRARALFARALETPGGLKIQTIHAFCEKLLKRFPLEAGVSPAFTVLEDAAAARLSKQARDALATFALANADGAIGKAYAHLSVQLSQQNCEGLFSEFEHKRDRIAAYVGACAAGVETDVWMRMGFTEVQGSAAIGAAAADTVDWQAWAAAARALAAGGISDQKLADAMTRAAEAPSFETVWSVFCTKAGELRAKLGTNAVDPGARAWLAAEQARLAQACERIKAAVMAEETVHALALASAYISIYEAEKSAADGLDFSDLIGAVHRLLTEKADAAWVLYKLDGGVDHILVDEAQDTAPDQWDIVRSLAMEFFAGSGAREAERTLFAVGDEKQSIYSFQGAAPERFLKEAGEYRSIVEGGGGRFEQVPLLDSWRSTPEVLAFVDAVFRDPQAGAGLRPAGVADVAITHQARRPAGTGLVELWPLDSGDVAEEHDPWSPVDLRSAESATRRLADRIAGEIHRIVTSGETVVGRETPSAPRPARYGDFLILVRRRAVLFHEIIRALKRKSVPVGGADRLKLSEHVVFQDLLALTRFALYPGDDLTLAAILRSPVCSVDEDGLFDLAQPRRGSLWEALTERREERSAYAEAHALLCWFLAEAPRRPPFDLFTRLLSRLDPAGKTLRSRILTRLGREAEDALEAFLGEALKAEAQGLRDLERFVDAMAKSEIEVKREQTESAGEAGGEVRVMTVHGAKGLEAPIVFLPDTTTRATAQGGPLLGLNDGGFVFAPRKADDAGPAVGARAARETASEHESLRLLYVALTRARDRLIVCGVETRPAYFKGSWREVVERALADPVLAPAVRLVRGAGGAQVIRYGADPTCLPPSTATSLEGKDAPAWLTSLAAAETSRRYASPSQLADTIKGPSPSPLAAVGGLGRFRRGELIHRLLQLLPDIAPISRADAARRLLEREPDLTPDQRAEMAAAALGVLEDARFAPVFAPGSRPEVAIAGTAPDLPKGLAISGRIDRLLVEPERILVVDFKTNRPSPDRAEDADPAYLAQMAVYAAVLRAVFPRRSVEAALVWTDGPKLMPLPENLLAATLSDLGREA